MESFYQTMVVVDNIVEPLMHDGIITIYIVLEVCIYQILNLWMYLVLWLVQQVGKLVIDTDIKILYKYY